MYKKIFAFCQKNLKFEKWLTVMLLVYLVTLVVIASFLFIKFKNDESLNINNDQLAKQNESYGPIIPLTRFGM